MKLTGQVLLIRIPLGLSNVNNLENRKKTLERKSVYFMSNFVSTRKSKMPKDMIYTMKWQQFTKNFLSCLPSAFTETSFSDVTLVSDDHIPFHAHKYILSVFSPVLKNILLNNPHSHPLIYLGSVKGEELYSILQFIYFGNVLISPSNLNRLAQAAEDLQIKQLTSRCNSSMENIKRDTDDINVDNEVETQFEKLNDEIKDICVDTSGSDKPRSDKPLNQDENSDEKFQAGSAYQCQYCKFMTKHKSSFKAHQEIVHQGVKYSCDKCEVQATTRSNLKLHHQIVHEGKEYLCDHCDYKAKYKEGLKYHTRKKHKGLFNSQCVSSRVKH